MLEKMIAIVGPTASGKSALAVRLARRFNGEIIAVDSRQVYRGLNIGSGKITKKETGGVRHHLLDVANPKRTFTAARYKKLAEGAAADIWRRGRVPIFCGGTGFYLDAALGRVNLGAVPPNQTRRRKLEKLTAEKLFAKLQKAAPAWAKKIDRHNRRRLIRAIEVATALGHKSAKTKVSPWVGKDSPYQCLKIGLIVPNEELKTRIKNRLRQELRTGLIAEVKNLRRDGLSWRRLEALGLEYRYASRHLRGQLTKNEMIKKLETEIWHYGKRQMTWFKRDQNIHWIKTAPEAERLAKKFLKTN